MTISATVIKDSFRSGGTRITTLSLRYPRFIHAEFMTHRMFSRNASSSRAIPVSRLIEDLRLDPVYPSHWGKNQKGMQAHEELDAPVVLRHHLATREVEAKVAWDAAREGAILIAEAFTEAGYHKQIVNRLLEPFAHINVLVTATEWENFFKLRIHPDAQPEIHELALRIKEAMDGSDPTALVRGEWHIPYDPETGELDERLMVSAARCARISYRTFEGKRSSVEDDLPLANQLRTSGHWSPFEHQARVQGGHDEFFANFRGFRQYRGVLEC